MHFSRHFTSANKPVAEQITCKTARAFIPGAGVDILIEVPEGWSQTATNILAKNYLRKAGVPTNVYRTSMHEIGDKYQPPGWLHPSIPEKDTTFGPETSARQVFHRLAGHWTYVGWKHKYFDSETDAQVFYDEIFWMLAHQIAAPNSPQWFNTGLWWAYGISGPASGQWAIHYPSGEPYETTSAYEHPQPHACFIQPVSDDLVNPGGIMDLWVREVRLFKQGSGTGTNFSSIRGRGEPLSGGGVSSGLMSFLRIGDVAAGAIASGGTTRRAAKMVCLDLDHPEIEDFINWKVREERKARALVAGSGILNDGGEVYSSAFEGEAISTVSGQNSNNSVRITDEFLRKVDADEPWDLWPRSAKKVGVGTPTRTLSSRSLWHSICAAAHASADPGIQFHDTINAWHTCAADGEINASNPCGEYNFVDNTACNLASINLVSCLMGRNHKAGDLDLVSFEHATRLWTIVLDISVTMASFPSREIALGSYNYRTLGLGYANLGALLMRQGLAYDSDEGRALAAALTALMHGVAYLTSAEMAKELGPFPRWLFNAESMRKVILKHGQAENLNKWPREIQERDVKIWEQILKTETLVGGFRNAQVTLLAPTGTISFVMDCDTTGVEPDFALKRTKQLAGGGTMELVNESVGPALVQLGYKAHQRNLILAYIDRHGTAEGCPDLLPEHLPVFDCANAPEGFTRTLAPMAHVKMVATVQPFLSGAVSKTVNLPNSATVEDVSQIYREAHRLGLKAVALYREGSKMTQPLKASGKSDDSENRIGVTTQEEMTERIVPRWPVQVIPAGLARGERERLPTRCSGYCQKFRIDGHAVYVHTGEYPDGRLGQIFIEMSDEGSTLRALANALAKAVSIGIQFGTPLEEYVEAFVAARFEPAGIVEGHESIKICSSVLSAIFRDLGIHYFGREDLANKNEKTLDAGLIQGSLSTTQNLGGFLTVGTAPTPRLSGQFCSCGMLMVRTGPCLTCPACGNTTGCG